MPPRWIVEPSDTSVERNRHVALHCQAQGVPTPDIVWKKATGTVFTSFNGFLFMTVFFFLFNLLFATAKFPEDCSLFSVVFVIFFKRVLFMSFIDYLWSQINVAIVFYQFFTICKCLTKVNSKYSKNNSRVDNFEVRFNLEEIYNNKYTKMT